MLPASPGLSIYYEGVLDRLEGPEELSTMDDINDEEIYEELLDELETESKYIH